jgi:hypothetical protein
MPRGEDFFREIPATKVILIAMAASFLVGLLWPPLQGLLAFRPDIPNLVTGLVTYPFVFGNDIIGLLLSGLMMFWFGGSLERSWGLRTYVLFLLGTTVAAIVVWEIGNFLLLGGLVSWFGPWLMISSVIVAWAWLNPQATILFMFVLPMRAIWIGWLDIVLLYFMMPGGVSGPRRFLLGFFALGGVALAIAFVKYQKQWGWIPRKPRAKTVKPVRHPASGPFGLLLRPYREWQRRRRIAQLERTFKLDD